VAALAVRNVSKHFGGVRALDRASLTLLHGEVHGLLGENGSGKSTLIRILAGYHAPDSGAELAVAGRSERLPLPPGRARELGIAFVHQDLGLIPSLSVVENLRMSELAARRDWLISWRREYARAREALARFGLDLDPRQPVASLSPVARALLSIVRAAEELGGKGVLVLDEPTAFLPASETRRLFAFVRELVGAGASVLFVSHDLEEVLELADRVTVLRDGRVVVTLGTAGLQRDSVAELMTGRPLDRGGARRKPAGRVAASVSDLTGEVARGVSFDIYQGEVLGLSGLLGSGFEEIPYLLFGAQRRHAGRLDLGHDRLDAATMTPHRALRAGIALLAADVEREAAEVAAREQAATDARQRVTDLQRDLDGARGALPSAAPEPRVEPAGPAEQLERLEARRVRVQRTPTRRVERRFMEQALGKGADVESGAAHHHGKPPAGADVRDPPRRIAREVAGAVARARLDQVDPVVGHPRPLLPRGLGGPDVEPAVDLPRIGGDDLERPVRRESEGDRGLPDRRGPDQYRHLSAGQIVAPVPRGGVVRWWPARARRAAGGRWRTIGAGAAASRARRGAGPP